MGWITASRKGNAVSAGHPLDAAANVPRNVPYWSNAQDLLADEYATPNARAAARARSRLVYRNAANINSGVRCFTSDVIGAKGPKLKITPAKSHPLVPDITKEEKDIIEWEWYFWAKETQNIEKLRRVASALMYDGEAFLMSVFDPRVEGAELNYQEIESKRVASPLGSNMRENELDGIVFDGMRPSLFYVQKTHVNPLVPPELDMMQIPAENMLHIAWLDMIGQNRGLPMLQCVLQMQADLHRYRTLTLAAAAQAAQGAGGYMKTQHGINLELLPPFGDAASVYTHCEPGMVKFIPPGMEPVIPDVKFPTNTFADFNNTISDEVSSGYGVPGCRSSMRASDHNYSSLKVVERIYFTFIANVQSLINDAILDRQFCQWFECMASVEDNPTFQNIFNRFRGRIDRIPREWKYAKPVSLDMLKDAQAWEIMERNHWMSPQMIREELGVDSDDVMNDFEEDRKNDTARLVDEVSAIIGGQYETIVKNIVNEAMKASGTKPPDETPGTPTPPNAVVASADFDDEKDADDPAIPPPRPYSAADLQNLITAAQAAERIGVSAGTIHGWRKAGLPYCLLGKRIKYLPEDIHNFIAAGRVEAGTQPPSPSVTQPLT